MKYTGLMLFAFILTFASSLSAEVFMKEYRAFEGHRTTVHKVAFSRDGKNIIASGGNNSVIVWDVASGKRVSKAAKNPRNKPLNYIAVNDSATLIASSGFMDPAVRISDFNNGSLLRSIKAHSGEKSGLRFVPGSNLLVTAGIDAGNRVSLKVWNAASGKLVKVLYRSPYPVNSEYISGLSFSRDGSRLVCGISNKRHGIMIFDMDSMKRLKYIPYSSDVSDVAFSPDGRYIAGGGTDKKVVLWNAVTGQIVRVMSGHRGYVNTVAFSPDGKYIASSGMGYRNIFRLWDAKSGRLIQAMAGRHQGINSLAFSPNGKYLAAGVTTHGDLFKIDTVRLFSTASAFKAAPWYELRSNAANLKVSFPGEPEIEERYKSDRHYAYSRFRHSKGNSTYYIRVVEYLYNVSPQKGEATAENTAKRLVDMALRRRGKLAKSGTFFYRGNNGVEYLVLQKKRSSVYRRHYRVIFIGNKLYELRFTGYGEESSPGEKRFFESFGTVR